MIEYLTSRSLEIIAFFAVGSSVLFVGLNWFDTRDRE